MHPLLLLSAGDPLPLVSELCLLGLIIDDRLSWWPLVRDLVKRAKAKVWSLAKYWEAGASREQLLSVYVARVRSTLEYGSQVFDCLLNESQAEELEAVQQMCLQIIMGSSSGSYGSNLSSLGLVTLADSKYYQIFYIYIY